MIRSRFDYDPWDEPEVKVGIRPRRSVSGSSETPSETAIMQCFRALRARRQVVQRRMAVAAFTTPRRILMKSPSYGADGPGR